MKTTALILLIYTLSVLGMKLAFWLLKEDNKNKPIDPDLALLYDYEQILIFTPILNSVIFIVFLIRTLLTIKITIKKD